MRKEIYLISNNTKKAYGSALSWTEEQNFPQCLEFISTEFILVELMNLKHFQIAEIWGLGFNIFRNIKTESIVSIVSELGKLFAKNATEKG